MAIGPPIVLAPLFLEDGDGAGSTLVDDFGLDGGPFDQRLSDCYSCVAVNQPNLAEFDRPPDLAGKGFHLDQRSSFNAILLAACLNDCVHNLPPLQKMIV